jgi:hypothetical protein
MSWQNIFATFRDLASSIAKMLTRGTVELFMTT